MGKPQPRRRFAAATSASREESHRRLTLLGVATLLLLSTSPVFGHHLPVNTDTILAGVDHIGTLCVTALHLLFEPVHYVFHAIIVCGLLYAVLDRVRAWSTVRRVLRSVDARGPTTGDVFWRAAVAAGLDPRRLRIVPGLPNPAFTVGLFSPRVFVAELLVERLTEAELVAVLAHENAHVVRRDPLRVSVLRALASTLFWIPALRRLAADVADESEVLADDAAARGRPLVLASAILTLAQWPRSTLGHGLVVGFDQPDLLDRRVRRLAGEEVPAQSHVTRRSILTAAAALALVWSSGVLVAHPLPATSPVAHERHCDHGREWALSHLFCLGSPFATSAADCPHQHHA